MFAYWARVLHCSSIGSSPLYKLSKATFLSAAPRFGNRTTENTGRQLTVSADDATGKIYLAEIPGRLCCAP